MFFATVYPFRQLLMRQAALDSNLKHALQQNIQLL